MMNSNSMLKDMATQFAPVRRDVGRAVKNTDLLLKGQKALTLMVKTGLENLEKLATAPEGKVQCEKSIVAAREYMFRTYLHAKNRNGPSEIKLHSQLFQTALQTCERKTWHLRLPFDYHNPTVLHYALKQHFVPHPDSIQLLIDGVIADSKKREKPVPRYQLLTQDPNGDTVAHLAARAGPGRAARLLGVLASFVQPVNNAVNVQQFPSHNDVRALSHYVFDVGIPLHAVNFAFDLPLHVAVRGGTYAAVAKLAELYSLNHEARKATAANNGDVWTNTGAFVDGETLNLKEYDALTGTFKDVPLATATTTPTGSTETKPSTWLTAWKRHATLFNGRLEAPWNLAMRSDDVEVACFLRFGGPCKAAWNIELRKPAFSFKPQGCGQPDEGRESNEAEQQVDAVEEEDDLLAGLDDEEESKPKLRPAEACKGYGAWYLHRVERPYKNLQNIRWYVDFLTRYRSSPTGWADFFEILHGCSLGVTI